MNDQRVIQEARGSRRGRETLPALDWRGVLGRRLGVLLVVFLTWAIGLEARLIYLQVFQYDTLMARAVRQQEDRERIPGTRGDIVDRNGSMLAMSVRGHALMAARRSVEDPVATAARVCKLLDACTADDRQAMVQALRPNDKGKNYVYVRRELSLTEADRMATELNDPALFLEENSQRYYPNGATAAHVLGFVNFDNQGQTGIEKAEEKRIEGRPGRKIVQVAGGSRRTRLSSRVLEAPTTGATIELTIDKQLQFIAERELAAAIDEHNAEGGTVLIMDPWNGDILAMANAPTFDPNKVGQSPAEARQNRAALQIYEPGSTFKIVTAAAALQERHIPRTRIYDINGGVIRFGKWTIRDVHHYSTLSFEDVFVKSSNVGAIRVGLELGPDIISRYVSRFGFGEIHAKDIPHQRSGIVDRNMARFDDLSIASVSMGYHIGVTALQMISAFSSVANGGELVAPRLVRATITDGKRVPTETRVVRRTVTPEIAASLTDILEQVVERGTAKGARIPGYSIAGKTGTAKKLVDGRYSHTHYNASFVGFIPSRRPKVAILAVLDSPRAKGYYGGTVAAPLFKSVAEATLRYLGVPPNLSAEPPVLVARNEPMPVETVVPVRAPSTVMPAVEASLQEGVMPDVRGLSARDALRILARMGVEARVSGDGFVALQAIAPGTPIAPGRVCALTLRRQLIPVGEAGATQ